MKNTIVLRKFIREAVRRQLQEKSAEELKADIDAVNAEIVSAKLKIKTATANVKAAKERLQALTRKKTDMSGEAPTMEESILIESDVIPVGPDGSQIKDQQVIRNLNMAVKAVNSSLRPKLIALITDPEAAKSLKSPAQRTAVIGAIAIAFGISEDDFSQIVTKIKGVLKKASSANTTNDQA